MVNINLCSVKERLVTGEASVGVKAMKAGKITTRCRFFGYYDSLLPVGDNISLN